MKLRLKLKGLYAVTPANIQQLERNVEAVLQGGASVIQFRNKTSDAHNRFVQARQLKALCVNYGAIFIINDDIELAMSVDADGVHIGQNDMSLSTARSLLGPDKIIGVSCYNQLSLAVEAQENGADYVAFGRFFPSRTKPDALPAELSTLKDAKRVLSIPVVAIGGITVNNAHSIIESGADAIAVVGALFEQPDIKKTAQEFSGIFDFDLINVG